MMPSEEPCDPFVDLPWVAVAVRSLPDANGVELRDAQRVAHFAVEFGHDAVAHELEGRTVLRRDGFGRLGGAL